MDRDTLARLIETTANRVIAATEELTALDSAIGDGDHGTNMSRGMTAVLGKLDELSGLPLPEALKGVGTTLVMSVGGASGPLFGTFFRALGAAIPAAPTMEETTKAFGAAIEAVKARGKSAAGQKTLLDVLIPVHAAMCEPAPASGLLREVAADSLRATNPMRATRGRASFLGDRSIGHLDPGARTAQIMIDAVIDVLEGTA